MENYSGLRFMELVESHDTPIDYDLSIFEAFLPSIFSLKLWLMGNFFVASTASFGVCPAG